MLTTLLEALQSSMGDEWLTFEPETICIVLGIEPEEEDAIEAIRCLITSDLPWQDPFVFENCVDGLCGNPVLSDVLTVPELEEMGATVKIMTILKPDAQFSTDVCKYIAAAAMTSGFVWLPNPLDIANEFIKETDSSLQQRFLEYQQKNEKPVDDDLDVLATKHDALSMAIEELFTSIF